jgi:putative oxygen-independent coproporphyrinogen III oxidase
MRTMGVYVHFPWCLNKCPYCDFVSYGARREDTPHRAYADAVLRELELRRDQTQAAGRVDSVFFGGGTPSLWDAAELGRVLDGIVRAFEHAPEGELEITVECNPTSLDEPRARALLDVGVNRLSIGVQSLRDDRLRYLGRLHDAAGAVKAVLDAKRAGARRVSGDLIFGLPGQSPEDARHEALELVDLGLDHVSCYQLTIEPGTRFGELARRGRLPLADDGVVAEAFLAIDEAVGARGFAHYEVSNYARPGQEARHNLGYWRGDEYLGLGCGAYGFVRTGPPSPGRGGERYRNEVLPERYMIEADATAAAAREPLDGPTLLRERIMLGLRMDEGLDLDAAADDVGAPAWTPQRLRAAVWLEERGRIVREGSRLRVPRAAWLWTDDTAARLF